MEYNEATYLLINDGHDYINGQQQTPQSWWPGFDVDLGEAAGSRYSWNGVLRRDFAGGVSLVNPPGSPTVTVSLPGPMRTAAGSQVSSVTLGPAAGAVLAGSAPAPAAPSAAPSPTPASVSGPVATETVLQTTEVPSPQSHPASPAFASSSGSGHRPHLQRHSHSHRRHRRGATGHARTASRRPATRSRGLTRVSGSVIHATGGTVTIRIEVRVHGRWRLARSLPLDVGQSGAFGRILRLVHGGLYRARALYAGTAAYAPSSSGYRLLVLHTR
jgi:hypothetical protein